MPASFLIGYKPKSALSELRDCETLSDLSRLLGYKPSALSYVLYKIPDAAKYTQFEVPKRSGGTRLISAPTEKLKALQRSLADLLKDCLLEIDASHGRRVVSHGFRPGYSIFTNAHAHRSRRFILNIDLVEFFDSFNFGRVRGFFIKSHHFKLKPDVATVIAQIAVHDNKLPQGAPTSPIVTNLLGHVLDVRLLGLARHTKTRYSRYADDITFSTNAKDFPIELAIPHPAGGEGTWVAASDLLTRLTDSGFSANSGKTRLQYRGSRQEVTGLITNVSVNVRSEYYRGARAMVDSLLKSGTFTWSKTPGYPLPKPKGVSGGPTLGHLEGVLGFIHQIRDRSDGRGRTEKLKTPNSARALYRDLLHYKHFSEGPKPLLVTEGKTDVVYLREAIKALYPAHPKLASGVAAKPELLVSFLNYTKTVHDVLQLGGGTGDLKFLIIRYRSIAKRVMRLGSQHPVIIVVDNDQGAKDLFASCKDMMPVPPTLTSTDAFYHVVENLYLVKVPEAGTANRPIETLFDPSLLKTKVAGKEFDPDTKSDSGKHYGKVVFAEKVVKPNAGSIDFKGFSPLLKRIESAIEHYEATA